MPASYSPTSPESERPGSRDPASTTRSSSPSTSSFPNCSHPQRADDQLGSQASTARPPPARSQASKAPSSTVASSRSLHWNPVMRGVSSSTSPESARCSSPSSTSWVNAWNSPRASRPRTQVMSIACSISSAPMRWQDSSACCLPTIARRPRPKQRSAMPDGCSLHPRAPVHASRRRPCEASWRKIPSRLRSPATRAHYSRH